MASEQDTDEEIVLGIPDEILAQLSADQRGALNNLLARLNAAERVCEMVGTSLSPKARAADKGKRTYWWDVAGAVKEWEKLAKP
jgi:hypothetical protein